MVKSKSSKNTSVVKSKYADKREDKDKESSNTSGLQGKKREKEAEVYPTISPTRLQGKKRGEEDDDDDEADDHPVARPPRPQKKKKKNKDDENREKHQSKDGGDSGKDKSDKKGKKGTNDDGEEDSDNGDEDGDGDDNSNENSRTPRPSSTPRDPASRPTLAPATRPTLAPAVRPTRSPDTRPTRSPDTRPTLAPGVPRPPTAIDTSRAPAALTPTLRPNDRPSAVRSREFELLDFVLTLAYPVNETWRLRDSMETIFFDGLLVDGLEAVLFPVPRLTHQRNVAQGYGFDNGQVIARSETLTTEQVHEDQLRLLNDIDFIERALRRRMNDPNLMILELALLAPLTDDEIIEAVDPSDDNRRRILLIAVLCSIACFVLCTLLVYRRYRMTQQRVGEVVPEHDSHEWKKEEGVKEEEEEEKEEEAYEPHQADYEPDFENDYIDEYGEDEPPSR